jgi:hypothetical protein
VVVAGSAYVNLIDPATDAITGGFGPSPGLDAIDVAPNQAAGKQQLAVGFRLTAANPSNPSGLYELDLFDPVTTAVTRIQATALGLGSVLAFAADPWDATRLMMLDPHTPNPQALETVDPLAPSVTPYFAEPAGIGFHSLAIAPIPTGTGIMWAAQNTYNGYYTGNEPLGDGGAGPFLWGPIVCSGCNMIHAVPDPTDGNRAFVLCDAGGAVNTRIVYRVTRPSGAGNIQGSCVPVFNGTQLGSTMQLTHLAVVAP